MKGRIVVINGTGGVGKNKFVEYAGRYAQVFNFSSIAKVKEIAQYIGWDGKKTEKDRKFLSDLKNLTTEYNDMAFKSIKDAVKMFRDMDAEILFIHIREPEEIQRVVDKYKALTLLIKRDSIENIQSNSADANVDNYNYDYVVRTSSPRQLDVEAKRFVDKLRKEDINNCK